MAIKKYIVWLTFFVLCFEIIYGKNNDTTGIKLVKSINNYKHFISIEADYLLLAVSYSKKIKESSFYWGGSFGAGASAIDLGFYLFVLKKPKLLYIGRSNNLKSNFNHDYYELLYGQIYFQKFISNRFFIESGLRVGYSFLVAEHGNSSNGNVLSFFIRPYFSFGRFIIGSHLGTVLIGPAGILNSVVAYYETSYLNFYTSPILVFKFILNRQ